MRRTVLILTSLSLVVVPVAAAADKPEKADKLAKPETAVTVATVDAAHAVGVTATHVTLEAAVVPGDAVSTATFEYGPTTGYGSSAAAKPAPLPRTGATASASIDHLSPSTTYHFRAVLRSADSALAGADATFTTAAAAAGDRGANGKADTGAKGKTDTGAKGKTDTGAKGKTDTGAKGKTGKEPSEPAKELAPVHAPQAPVLGQSVAVGPRAGTVRVRSADGKTFALTAGASIPAGSVIDATNGTVAMTSALDANGHVQTAEFSGGRFLVRQSATGDGTVDIYVKGSIGRCHTKAKTARLASTSSIKRPARRLWARDSNGKFRTHGKDSVASVRGTRWLTEDTCAGTRTRVSEGTVAVRDLGRKRTVLVRAGHSYLARHSG